MKKISNRLLTILKIIKKTNVIADIGTDHAIIPCYIIKNKLAKKCIATDIKENIIFRLKNELSNNLLKEEFEKIDFRVGSGLKVLGKYEANVIIISGMGCDLIKDILSNINEYKFKYLIISPQTKICEFRKFIINKKLKIIKEYLIKDAEKFYFIFKIKKSILKIKYRNFEYLYSRNLIKEKNTYLIEYIKKSIFEYKRIFNITNKEIIKEYIDLSIKTLKRMGVKYDL